MVQKQVLARKSPRAVIILGSVLCAGLALTAWWYLSGKTTQAITSTSASGMTCDMGVSAAKAARGVAAATPQPAAANNQTAQQTAQPVRDSPGTNIHPPPGPAPDGMVWIYINIAANQQDQWEAVCDVLGVPELTTDPRFEKRDTRKANRKALTQVLEARLYAATDRALGRGAQRARRPLGRDPRSRGRAQCSAGRAPGVAGHARRAGDRPA